MRGLIDPLRKTFVFDPRALAAFRVALGFVVLWKSVIEWSDLEMFYTDLGVVTRSQLLQRGGSWSLYFLSGTVFWSAVLMTLQVLAAAAFTVGWRTRWANLILWGLVASLQARNTLLLHSGDTVLRVVLFWSLFCPLGSYGSLDVWRAGAGSEGKPVKPVFNAGLLALQAQIMMIYIFGALKKTDVAWTRDGTAIYTALQADLYVLPFGKWLVLQDELCRLMSLGVVWVELLGPLLLLLPFRRSFFRLLAVGLFLGLHLGFALCLDLGPFSFTMMALWLLFLPACFWDWLGCCAWGRTAAVCLRAGGEELLASYPRCMNWLKAHASPENSLGKFGSKLMSLFCLCGILYVAVWNWRQDDEKRRSAYFPPGFNKVAYLLRLTQNWTMYAPSPFTDDGWFLLEATLRDGSHVDLLREGQPVDYAKPNFIADTFPNYHWRKCLINLREKGNKTYLAPFGQYLARKWNSEHLSMQQVQSWKLIFMSDPIRPEHQIRTAKQVQLWRWSKN